MALAAAPVEEAAEPDDKLFMTTQKEPREATAAPTPGPQPVFEDEEEQQEDDGPPAEDEDEAFSSDDEGERSLLLSAALSLGLRLPIQPVQPHRDSTHYTRMMIMMALVLPMRLPPMASCWLVAADGLDPILELCRW